MTAIEHRYAPLWSLFQMVICCSIIEHSTP
jgi:hypothetical protein